MCQCYQTKLNTIKRKTTSCNSIVMAFFVLSCTISPKKGKVFHEIVSYVTEQYTHWRISCKPKKEFPVNLQLIDCLNCLINLQNKTKKKQNTKGMIQKLNFNGSLAKVKTNDTVGFIFNSSAQWWETKKSQLTLLSYAVISFWLAVERRKDCIWALSVSSFNKKFRNYWNSKPSTTFVNTTSWFIDT